MSSSRTVNGLYTPYLRDCPENIEPIEATIEGQVPTWLSGCFLSNGSGGFKFGSNKYQHFFDGPALLRKFTIKNGRIVFEAKYLDTETLRQNRKHNRIIVTEFGTRGYPDPCKTIFERLENFFLMKDLFNDNDQVTFWNISDQLYAVGETPKITQIDQKNLETLKRVDLRDIISISTAAAHVHTDRDGNIFAMGNTINNYNIVRVQKSDSHPSGLDLTIVGRIPVSRPLSPSYYHSFCITERFFVFIEQPLVLSVPSLLWEHYSGGTNSRIMNWRPEFGTQIHLLNREDGSIWPIVYQSGPFAFFHTINAYEDDDHVVVDICCYRDAGILRTLTAEAMQKASSSREEAMRQAELAKSQAMRFVLPLHPGSPVDEKRKSATNLNHLKYSQSSAYFVSKYASQVNIIPEPLTTNGPVMAEMPTINYLKNGQKYRYFYALRRRQKDLLLQLMKCDTLKKRQKIWFQNDYYPSEPIFVPKPGSTEEDDGVVLSYVVSEVDEHDGFLLLLDGISFQEIGRARFRASSSHLIPQFHAIFLPDHGLQHSTDSHPPEHTHTH
ncbi:carotenoid-cleaving dioxygenase, mitochondrial-like [Brevipalpus obovatus]|uniref:carotenoid-cleaving dioxygenase, mitochondrial-like n=1 Tax=Brevipalpus obovatus TaxID=246614 RepID=UPI003D9E8418